jgi:raffinose/stachyose/melibiose transport system permease protein
MTIMKHEHEGEAVKIGFARPGWSKRHRSGALAGIMSFRWILAAFVLILWFVYYPIIDNFVVSTKNQDIFTGETAFVGLDNYRRLKSDPVVSTAIVNNTLYAVISVVFQVFGAFVLAALIEGLRDERWRRFWRAVYFVPSAISITVTGLLFYFIYQPDIGLLDSALTHLGLVDW